MIEEHGHHHAHGTGVRWLDMIVGLSAIFISVVSLVVSFEHGRTMRELVRENEKLVAANTIPFLDFTSSNLDDATHKPYFKFTLKNGGVGPAQIDWFELRYKGAALASPNEFLNACCADAVRKDSPKKGSVWYSTVSNNILPARDSFDPITLRPDVGDDVLRAIYQAQSDIKARACYCSVLDECWITDFKAQRPAKVERCEHAPNGVYW